MARPCNTRNGKPAAPTADDRCPLSPAEWRELLDQVHHDGPASNSELPASAGEATTHLPLSVIDQLFRDRLSPSEDPRDPAANLSPIYRGEDDELRVLKDHIAETSRGAKASPAGREVASRWWRARRHTLLRGESWRRRYAPR